MFLPHEMVSLRDNQLKDVGNRHNDFEGCRKATPNYGIRWHCLSVGLARHCPKV
jgi:hypothetical protein